MKKGKSQHLFHIVNYFHIITRNKMSKGITSIILSSRIMDLIATAWLYFTSYFELFEQNSHANNQWMMVTISTNIKNSDNSDNLWLHTSHLFIYYSF